VARDQAGSGLKQGFRLVTLRELRQYLMHNFSYIPFSHYTVNIMYNAWWKWTESVVCT